MRRDMDLCRQLLLAVEREDPTPDFPDHTEAAILAHIEWLVEAGLLKGAVLRSGTGHALSASVERLTWAGADFLDASRNEGLWQQAKQKILEHGEAWTFETLKTLLESLLKQSLGL
jgi:hypothetical protein